MISVGTTSAFPSQDDYQMQGITYREYLIAHIAPAAYADWQAVDGGTIGDVATDCIRLADEIIRQLDAENA